MPTVADRSQWSGSRKAGSFKARAEQRQNEHGISVLGLTIFERRIIKLALGDSVDNDEVMNGFVDIEAFTPRFREFVEIAFNLETTQIMDSARYSTYKYFFNRRTSETPIEILRNSRGN